MPSNSQIISEFNHIAITDADGALEGLSVAKLEVADIANLTIPGGTQGQVIATDGSGNLSWANGGSGGGAVIAENGTVTCPLSSGTPISTSNATPTKVLTFDLPSAGTWEITACLSVGTLQPTSSYAALYSGSTTTPAAIVTGSIQAVGGISGGAGIQIGTDRVWTVTTTGAATYSVGMWGSGTVVIYTVDGGGITRGIWKKISGYIPSTGTLQTYAKYTRSTVQTGTLSTGSRVICNVLESSSGSDITVDTTTGQITLAGGKTYRLRGQVPAFLSTIANSRNSFQWYNETTSAWIGSGSDVYQPSDGAQGLASGGTAEYIFTTSATTIVSFRVSGGTGLLQLGATPDFPASGSYPWIDIEVMGTSSVAQFVGTLSSVYSQSLSYPAGTIVVKDGMLYQSNGTVSAGTTFVLGTTGATWSQIGFGQVTAESGSVSPLNGQSFVSAGNPDSPWTDITNGSFTLGAGTWQVEYLLSFTNANGSWVQARLLDPNGNPVADSRTSIAPGSGTPSFVTATATVTTSGSSTYKLQARAFNGSTTVVQNYTAGTTGAVAMQGQSYVRWNKISGFVPAIGSVGAYTNAIYVASQPAAGSTGLIKATTVTGNIPYNSATGVWTLTAGQTYQLWITWQTTTANELDVAWVDATTNFAPPNILAGYTIGNNTGPQTSGIYTPTTNQQLKLWVTFTGGGQISGRFQASIVQLGTTNATAFLGSLTNGWSINNTYPSGTIVVKDGMFYQANDTILAGTTFSTGTTGTTWSQIGFGSVSAETGSVTNIANQSTSSTSPVDVTGSTFTLPSAGIWSVTYEMSFYNNNSGGGTEIVIANSSTNAVVPGSKTSQNVSTNEFPTSKTVQITTTGPTQYKLRYNVRGVGTTFLATNNDIGAIYWNKISGFVPATGTVSSYLSLSGSTTCPLTTTIAAGTDFKPFQLSGVGIPYNISTGVMTLTAGISYEFILTMSQAYGETASTTNGGDTNIAICDATTLSILPGGEARAMGTQFSGRALSRSGTTVMVYTPTTNQDVKIRSTYVTESTGIDIRCSVSQLGTTSTTAFLGAVTNGWSINNTYASGTIVVKDGMLYQANSTIVAGTAFVVGATGATWLLLNSQVAEYNEAVVTSNINVPISNVAAQTADIISFTLPSAGVWEVQYNVRGGVGTTGSFMSLFLADNANAIVPNSTEIVMFISGVANLGYQGSTSMVTRITTTGPTVYKLRARASGDATAAVVFGSQDANGGSKVTWKKISGFLPLSATNEVSGYANADVAFDTGFGWALYLSAADTQFLFKNTSASTVNVAIADDYYIDLNASKGSSQRGKTIVAAGASTLLWTDGTLVMNGMGDIETGYVIVSTAGPAGYATASTVSKYEYYCSVGSAFNNNYYRVKKVW